MREYKIHLKINNEIVLTNDLVMSEIENEDWLWIRDNFREFIDNEEGKEKSVSLLTEIIFAKDGYKSSIYNEIFLNNESLNSVFSRLALRLCNDFAREEDVKNHEQGLCKGNKLDAKIRRMEKAIQNMEKREELVPASFKLKKRQLSMRKNIEFINALKEMGEATKNFNATELSEKIKFDKSDACLRYLMDFVGIEYRKYR
ncbi:hypothetical protein [Aquitalea pelogenes]|uniref:hypothetical protein n=1 Tax=Aquitalea pelogenes TaxID=1293573 RepID=UPI0035AE0015